MTLPTSTRVTDPYETDGVQRDFEFDFPAFYNPDTGHYGIEVRRLTALDYEVIDKSLYDIFLTDENKSGFVRFHVAPMAGDDIYIAGDTTRSQQLNLINYGRYHAESVEKGFDLVVALIQEFVSKVDEETRQRILADQALRDFLLIKFNQFTAEVTTKIDKHIGDINGFMSSLIPMFVCIMRKELAYYIETGMQDVIDEKLSDLSNQVANALDVLDESVSRINEATTATAIAARLFDTPAAGVHPVTGVPVGSYFNVRSPNADSYVDEYQNVGGNAVATGKRYLSSLGVQQQEKPASTIVDKSGKNLQEIVDANSKGFVNLALYTTPLFADVAPILNALHAQLSDGDTLYIPNGDWNVDSEIAITKQINFICDGNLIFSNKVNAKITFTHPEMIRVPASALSVLPKYKDVQLKFTTKPTSLTGLLNEYHVILTSTEEEIVRVGYADNYTKNEPNDIITQDGFLRTAINLDYTDASKLNLDFYKKRQRVNIKIRGKVNLNGATTKPSVVQFTGWNNSINDIQIDRIGSVSAGTSVGFSKCCLMTFRDSWVSGANVAGESSYAFSNFISGFILFDNCGYQDGEGTGERERGYSGRHGNCVVFNSCKFTGLDDHYGWNYHVYDMDFVTRSILFAGGSLSLTNCRGLSDNELVQLRSDTPFANGTLSFTNCDAPRLIRSIRPIAEVAATKRKMWDTIVINGGTVDSKNISQSAIWARSFMPQDIKEQTTLIINDLIFIHRHKDVANCLVQGGTVGDESNPQYNVFKKITLNNVQFIDATDKTATTEATKATALYFVRADEVEINNSTGIAWNGCRFGNLRVNGGTIAGQGYATLGSASTGKFKFSNTEFVDGDYILTNSGTNKIYLFNTEIGADIFNLSSVRGYVEVASGCTFTTSAARANAAFDVWDYRKAAVGYRAQVAPSVSTLNVGATTAVATTPSLSKGKIGDLVVGRISNMNSKGVIVNAWISADGIGSYYLENPNNNPQGIVDLTGAVVTLEIK